MAEHFNDADKKIKADIDDLLTRIDDLRTSIENVRPVDEANLYTEFQEQYSAKNNAFFRAKRELIQTTFKFKQEVENKKLHTTEFLELLEPFSLAIAAQLIEKINDLINRHNQKSERFTQAKKDAAEKIRKHLLSGIYDDVQSLDTQINQIRSDIEVLEDGDPSSPENVGITRLQERIAENKKKISQSGLACDELNRQLKIFLGRRELVFEVDDEGYILKRGGKIANNLSEGEKTAIAFVHFTISLKDQDFSAENGIVVIDDPVSSLDF